MQPVNNKVICKSVSRPECLAAGSHQINFVGTLCNYSICPVNVMYRPFVPHFFLSFLFWAHVSAQTRMTETFLNQYSCLTIFYTDSYYLIRDENKQNLDSYDWHFMSNYYTEDTALWESV